MKCSIGNGTSERSLVVEKQKVGIYMVVEDIASTSDRMVRSSGEYPMKSLESLGEIIT